VQGTRAILEVDLFNGDGLDAEGKTALHHAALECFDDGVATDLILSSNVTVGAIDKDGKTVLHIAVENSLPNMVNRLVRLCDAKDQLLDVIDAQEETPLMKAVLKRNVEMVQTLLDAGANPNVLTAKGSALDSSLESGWEDVQSLLVAAGAMTGGALGVQAAKASEAQAGMATDDM